MLASCIDTPVEKWLFIRLFLSRNQWLKNREMCIIHVSCLMPHASYRIPTVSCPSLRFIIMCNFSRRSLNGLSCHSVTFTHEANFRILLLLFSIESRPYQRLYQLFFERYSLIWLNEMTKNCSHERNIHSSSLSTIKIQMFVSMDET